MRRWVAVGVITLWVLYDGYTRKAAFIPWAIGVLILTPVFLPIYLAVRPLKAGETREGGRPWNILKNFALTWTILMLAAGWTGMSAATSQPAADTEAGRAGQAIGTGIGLALIAAAWFFPMVGALVLGFFLKKSSVTERGPTGKLALAADGQQRTEA